MAKNNKQVIDSQEKLELAQKIAQNSKRVVKTYADVENGIISFFRRVLGSLNKIIFDSKFSKFAALIIAIIIYISVNAGNTNTLTVTQASQISDIPVQVIYNSVMYEISGVPEKVDVIVMGDMSDITLQKSQINSKLVCDLSGLTEGTYTIKLTPSNFISRLSVNVIDTPSATVTIKKKVTQRFNISYEFINTKAKDSIYTLGVPTFDTTEVLIRASQDTIDSISMVKALIDVTGVNESFTRESRIVAYDQQGQVVACDVTPETVNATVAVTTPNKEVPIIVRPSGKLADGYAIDKINLDYATVTIYAPESVLEIIDAIYIDLDVTGMSKDAVLSTALTIPAGANSISVTKVNMEIIVSPVTTAIIEDVKLQFVGNTNKFDFAPVDAADAYLDVEIVGTESNLAKITADDISVSIDVSELKVGTQSIPVKVVGKNTLVTYRLADGKTHIEIQAVEKG